MLACLPGLQNNDSLVTTILTQRQAQAASSSDPSNIAGLVNTPDILNAFATGDLGSYVTGTSTVFSGDIVAVAPYGRAFRRVKVIIDGGQTPARIIYRRDVTQYGWPLPDDIRQQLKSGQPPVVSSGFSGMQG